MGPAGGAAREGADTGVKEVMSGDGEGTGECLSSGGEACVAGVCCPRMADAQT